MLPLLTLLGLNYASAKPLEHKVVFFLDVSKSMCNHLQDDAKVDELRTQAKTVLTDSKNMGSINVSFYKFGTMHSVNGEFVPKVVPLKEDISPDEALLFVDDFFQYTQFNEQERFKYCTTNVFPDAYTYTATSVRYLLSDLLDLPIEQCDKRWERYSDKNPIPNIVLFGVTDNGDPNAGGGESEPCLPGATRSEKKDCKGDFEKFHPTNLDNIEWLNQRAGLLSNFNYQYWNIDNKNKEKISVRSDEVYYRVQWSGPVKTGNMVNLNDQGAELSWTFSGKDLPKLHLIPMIQNPQEQAKKNFKDLLFVNSSAPVSHDHMGEEQVNQLDVELTAHFDLESPRSLPTKKVLGIKLDAKPRRVSDGYIVKEPMVLPFSGQTQVYYEASSPADRANLVSGGEHVMHVNTQQLGQALSAQYPNASFIWDPKGLGGEATFNNCEVQEEETAEESAIPFDETLPALVGLRTTSEAVKSRYLFTWEDEGVSLSRPVNINFDRWGRAYSVHGENRSLQEVRTSKIRGEESSRNSAFVPVDSSKYTVNYSVSVVDATGKDIGELGGSAGDFIDVQRFQSDGTVVIPPVEGKIFDLTKCLGFCWSKLFKPSRYAKGTIEYPVTISLSVEPMLSTKTFSDVPNVRLAGEDPKEASSRSKSVTFEVNVDKVPWNYLEILITGILSILTIWFAWGWKTRPRFPEGWYLGNDRTLELRRRTNGIGDQWKSWKFNTFGARWVLKPPIYYIALNRSINNTVEWNATIPPTTHTTGFVLALSPVRGNKFRIWCAACQEGYTIQIQGENPMVPVPPEMLYNRKGKFNEYHPETDEDFGFVRLSALDLEETKFMLKNRKENESVTFTFTDSSVTEQ